MSNYEVAVVIPFYKSGKFAKQLAQALAKQSFRNFQIFIIDDGKGDGWDEIFYEIKRCNLESQLTGICTFGKTGPANARNIGIEFSDCRYVAFLDADDTWNSDFLEIMLKKIKHESCYAAVSEADYVSPKITTRLHLPKNINYNLLLQTNPIPTPAVVLDRFLISNLKFPNIGHEDYALWLSLTKKYGPILCVNEKLVSINRVPGSLSSNKIHASQWHWNTLKINSDKNLFSRILLFFIYAINGRAKRSAKNYTPLILPDSISKILP